ncbi:MAG: hypothetical protein EAZ27_11875 [Cytophagales bacterium]|nr:MAG: hypothetical protein EAZ27_11875 [Cytophagales bacterium]
MTKESFEALLIIKLEDFLSLIIEKNSDFNASLKKLYASNVYELLKNEETKMWQMSNYYLFDMLENENNDNAQ